MMKMVWLRERIVYDVTLQNLTLTLYRWTEHFSAQNRMSRDILRHRPAWASSSISGMTDYHVDVRNMVRDMMGR
jgi:hypothetical protein